MLEELRPGAIGAAPYAEAIETEVAWRCTSAGGALAEYCVSGAFRPAGWGAPEVRVRSSEICCS